MSDDLGWLLFQVLVRAVPYAMMVMFIRVFTVIVPVCLLACVIIWLRYKFLGIVPRGRFRWLAR